MHNTFCNIYKCFGKVLKVVEIKNHKRKPTKCTALFLQKYSKQFLIEYFENISNVLEFSFPKYRLSVCLNQLNALQILNVLRFFYYAIANLPKIQDFANVFEDFENLCVLSF